MIREIRVTETTVNYIARRDETHVEARDEHGEPVVLIIPNEDVEDLRDALEDAYLDRGHAHAGSDAA